MTENTVKQISYLSGVSAILQNRTHELHAMNDNEEPDPPPAAAARIPWNRPFTEVVTRRPAALPAIQGGGNPTAPSRHYSRRPGSAHAMVPVHDLLSKSESIQRVDLATYVTETSPKP